MTTTAGLDTATAVLEYARSRRADAHRAEADVLQAAVAWADQHPAESIHDAATWIPGVEQATAIAGPGAPLVSEFCIAEFALAIGGSTDAGRALVGQAVELAYRLPKIWARVVSGDLAPWRARRIAEQTIGLSSEGAGYVDQQLAAFAHKSGPVVVDRLVAEAIARFEPNRAQEEAEQAAEQRHFTIHHDHVSYAGTSRIEGVLDLADALDLDAALTGGAEQLKACGSTDSLDVRRSMAARLLARGDQTLEYGRDVVLYVHLAEDSTLARTENRNRLVTIDQVRTWCQTAGTRVTVKPVIDLNQQLRVDAYEVPERLAEHVQLRDGHCVFPWCTRPARGCDTDHVIPYQRGGPTASENLAALCRHHHRLKTHSTWTYTVIEPGTYLWSAPHGSQYLVDPTGTAAQPHR